MLKIEVGDGNGGDTAQVRKRLEEGHQHKYPAGLMTYTEPYRQERNRPIIALNPDGSSAMNVNGASTGGTPDNVHNGIDNTYWTGTNLSGTGFVFNSTDQAFAGSSSISGAGSVNSDEALLTRSSPLTILSYTALTGQIYVDSWPGAGTKEVRLRIRLGGVNIGTTIDISPYIDTGNQNAWQAFVIPLTDFGLVGTTMDEIVITTIDIGGGQAPNYYFDNLVLSSAAGGSPVSYRVTPREGEIILVKGFVYNLVFPWSAVATVTGATENFTANQFLSYNRFAHLSELPVGVGVRRVQGGGTGFSNVVRNNFDLLKATNHRIDTFFADDTNVMMKITTSFEGPVELDQHTGDYYEFTVNDDLSSLIHFEIRGRAVTINEALD